MNVKERHVPPAPDTVTVERDVIARLIEAELDQVWLADHLEGCCSRCCGPCSALQRLLDLGQLDDLVRPRAAGSDWWDAEHNQVDRAWLARAWRFTECADQHRQNHQNHQGATYEEPVLPETAYGTVREMTL